MKKYIVLIITGMISIASACTSAIISGRVTEDGRPLLWKHRDTGSLENTLVFVTGNGYDFMGVANARDSLHQEIWMGMNETGFAIMNTASYNVNAGVNCDVDPDQEGLFMRLALERCANLNDFEALLGESSGKWGIEANFGVIDAEGNAAFYETGYYEYRKYDLNDPGIAPDGYLIRTNFSYWGGDKKGQGYIRYDASSRLFEKQKKFSPEFIIKQATRNMDHGAMRTDIANMRLPRNRNDETVVAFRDYVVRYWSASVLVIQGIRPGEDPRNAVLWPIMGFPLTAMVTPVFFASGDRLPEVLQVMDGEVPFLAASALTLKSELFPLTCDNHANYLDVAKLANRRKDGYMQIVMQKENEIIRRAKALADRRDPEEITAYYQWLDRYVRDVYGELIPAKTQKDIHRDCGDEVCR